MFDTVITESVACSQIILRDKGDGEKYIGEKTQTVHNHVQESAIYSQKRFVRFGKREVIPHESAICLIALLRKAATNLYKFCIKIFKAEADLWLNQFQADLSA